jgi:transmembrane sensor
MNEQEALELLRKYADNQCTAQEIAAVESYFLHQLKTSSFPEGEVDHAAVGKRIWANISPAPVKRRSTHYMRYAAMAAIVITSVLTSLYFLSEQNKSQTNKTIAKEILPGGNSATLTLANGKEISLKSLNGKVSSGASSAIISNNAGNGVVAYQPNNSKSTKQHDEVNTIQIPRGGQYQLILSDGTRVYLNSATTLQFSVNFAANERKVNLITGEAYFEVIKDPKRPFIVTTKDQNIHVLGTHFNVSAYPDEPIKTTLAEGSVALTSSSSLNKQLLKPDQQALLLSNDKGFQIKNVNAADEIAWKDGDFVFNQISVEDLLRQLCRWYKVEADYTRLPNVSISGSVSKSRTLADVIKMIEFSNGIKITLSNERRLTVSKK